MNAEQRTQRICEEIYDQRIQWRSTTNADELDDEDGFKSLMENSGVYITQAQEIFRQFRVVRRDLLVKYCASIVRAIECAERAEEQAERAEEQAFMNGEIPALNDSEMTPEQRKARRKLRKAIANYCQVFGAPEELEVTLR